MNLTIPRQQLLTGLNSVAVALSAKCANPYGMFVLLSSTGDALNLATDSFVLRAEASIKASGGKGAALVSHQRLVALLQRDCNEVSLSADGNRLKVVVGDSLTHLPLMPVDGFPPAREDGESKAFVVLDNQAFSKSLSVVCPFAGDGLTHTWNINLLILDDGKNLTIAACDGKQFARIQLPSSGNAFIAAVPAKLARGLVAAISESESLTMTVFERSVKFDIEGLSIQLQQTESGYPHKQVIEVLDRTAKLCDHSITVERARLVSELQIASAVMERDEDGVGIEISTKPQALLIKSISKSSADHSIAIDTKVSLPMPRRRINHANLTTHLRSLDCDAVTMFYNPTAEPRGYRVSPQGSDSIQLGLTFFSDL